MAVNSTHPDYDTRLPAWLRARDVLAGEDAVKTAGEKYLPRLASQTDDEYKSYKARAAFFNASARTAEGFIGLVCRLPPFIKVCRSSEGSWNGRTRARLKSGSCCRWDVRPEGKRSGCSWTSGFRCGGASRCRRFPLYSMDFV